MAAIRQPPSGGYIENHYDHTGTGKMGMLKYDVAVLGVSIRWRRRSRAVSVMTVTTGRTSRGFWFKEENSS